MTQNKAGHWRCGLWSLAEHVCSSAPLPGCVVFCVFATVTQLLPIDFLFSACSPEGEKNRDKKNSKVLCVTCSPTILSAARHQPRNHQQPFSDNGKHNFIRNLYFLFRLVHVSWIFQLVPFQVIHIIHCIQMRTGPPISTSLLFCCYIREAYFNIFQVDPVISMIIPLALRHFGSDLVMLIKQR